MAMKNRESWEAVSENWRKGVEYIYSQLKSILINNGVEEICNPKDKFNPEIHHAVEEIPTDDESKDHQISEIVQKGYRTNKSVIRPAQVKIFIKK
jgi:molecular chaperone GrpE